MPGREDLQLSFHAAKLDRANGARENRQLARMHGKSEATSKQASSFLGEIEF